MRPDEHKKRKNTQYKKKHGLAADEKTQQSYKNDRKTVKSDKNPPKNPQDSAYKEMKQLDKENKGASNDIVASDEEFTFQKRKLVSNWSKYDDLPSDDDDDIPLQRGEDFSKLLAEAGGSAAQFRFKDEEDWSGEVETTSTTSVLALDLEEIAKSVMCLPLHERLGIDKHVFTSDQLEEIQSTCVVYQNKYDASQGGVVTVDKPVQSDRLTATSDRHIDTAIQRNKHETNTVDSRPDCKPNAAVKNNRTVVNENMCGMKKTEPAKHKEIASLEDDLDLLLSLDEPVKQADEQSKKPVQYDVNNKIGKSGKCGKECDDKQSNRKIETSIKGQDKGGNLEDWLDSMLDD